MSNPFNFEPEPLKGDTSCGCQHQEIEMDMTEFESEEEFRGGRRFPMRGGGLRSRPLRRPLGPAKRPLQPPPVRPKRPWMRPSPPPYRRPWPIAGVPDVYPEPHGAEPEPPTGSEHIRWVQDCLNQALGLQLPVTGLVGRETRSAVRSFQRQQGLRASGIVGPDTEEALKAACGSRGDQRPPDQTEFGSMFESERSRGLLRRPPELELPAEFQTNYDRLVQRMPQGHRGRWYPTSQCYPLSQWNNAPEQRGVYLLIFRNPSPRGHIGYVGETGNLYERIGRHHRDALRLGLDPGNYAFCWFQTSQHRAIEEAIRRWILDPTHGPVLFSNDRELEMEREF